MKNLFNSNVANLFNFLITNPFTNAVQNWNYPKKNKRCQTKSASTTLSWP